MRAEDALAAAAAAPEAKAVGLVVLAALAAYRLGRLLRYCDGLAPLAARLWEGRPSEWAAM